MHGESTVKFSPDTFLTLPKEEKYTVKPHCVLLRNIARSINCNELEVLKRPSFRITKCYFSSIFKCNNTES